MKKSISSYILFTVIVLEGYIILCTEILAIRQTVPFVGSGTATLSVIIAAVLMPLAFGYRAGGKYADKKLSGGKNCHRKTIRKKLVSNIVISMAIMLPGMTYVTLSLFFLVLDNIGIENKIAQVVIYSLIFLVTPIYLLGQTVPLISNYFLKDRLPEITGKMLFASTMGSFFGSVFVSLFMMQYLGTHRAVSVTFALMVFLVFLINSRKRYELTAIAFVIAGACFYLNSNYIMDMLKIVKNNKYNTIQIYIDDKSNRHLVINNNDSSMFNDMRRKHPYAELAEDLFINPTLKSSEPPKDILVIGAGGFTFGHDDRKNNYIYVDIDKDLKEVAEKYLLEEKLRENKTFYAVPARAYLSGTNKKFDLIFLDAYLGNLSIPEHLVTKNFFEEIKRHLKNNSYMAANFIVSPNFNNQYSKNIDNTLRSVFPHLNRIDTTGKYEEWNDSKYHAVNALYFYHHTDDYDVGGIYKDEAIPKDRLSAQNLPRKD